MKWFLGILAAGLAVAAEPWPLERLFTRPFAWGTTPERITWAKRAHVLGFLWNAAGGHFRDLYCWNADTGKLVRLTDLERLRDPLNRSAAEEDERQKNYLAPPEGVTDFNLAEDGSRAVFAYRGDLWMADTTGQRTPQRLTRTRALESAPQFSPDGKRLAFLRDGQLFVQDLASGSLWQVTELEGEAGGSLGAYRWSPDGTRFLYSVRTGQGRRMLLPNYSGRLVTAAPFPRTLPGDTPGESRIYVAPAESGTARAMEPGPWGGKLYGFEMPEWSPDSQRILYRGIHPNLKQQELLMLDAATGKATVAVEDSDPAWVEPMFATWSPDGKELLFTSERDGWSHLYRVPREGGKPFQITSGKWEIHTERSFARDPQWIGTFIYYSSTEAATSERQFYRIRPDGTGKERLSEKPGLHVGVVSQDGKCTATLIADTRNPFDLYVNGVRVTNSPQKEFWNYPWPESRLVSFPSRTDRRTVAARLFLPPGYNPDDRRQKPRPAILFIHGSGYATSVLQQWGSYVDLRYVFNSHLVNRGYVVLDADYRGSSGYGRDWRTDVYLHLGGKDFEDILGSVDYLRELGNIDMRRVGIWGSSYGGFMTAMAMFLGGDTFRAGASFSSVNDWENYNAFYTEQRLTKPSENPEAYRRSSPITYSGLLKNPLLIVHGMVDNNVLFQDAVQLSEKLVHEGKHFEQIYYPEESHAFVREETLVDAFRRATEFFDRNLR